MFHAVLLICMVGKPCDYQSARARIQGPLTGLVGCLLGAESDVAAEGLPPGEYVRVVCEAGVREARR